MTKSRWIILVFALLGIAVGLGILYLANQKYVFDNPEILWGLAVIPLLGIYEFWSADKRLSTVQLSSFQQFDVRSFTFTDVLVQIPLLLRTIALSVLIIALARPQSELSWKDVTTEGIDIIVTMDISASMLAKDFEPDRLESAKAVAIDFIKERPNDRIGLVVYEGESFTQCPLTTDHKVLTNLFKDVHTGMVENGTAIGMGLATAVSRLRDSEAKSKVVILLTDGENNSGSISPTTAAEIAQSYGVRVYTIGVGSRGKALSPTGIFPDGRYKYDYVDVNINEPALEEIAQMTGGKYFRATNNQALADIYQEIDRLEKTKINVTEHSQKAEEYYWLAVLASLLVAAEFIVKYIVTRTLP
jgi:Ca-activated chloride channel family protein